MQKKRNHNHFHKFEIPLWLSSYEDIFSDFDPRPYKHKALSTDFLEELKRASNDKDSAVPIELLVPSKNRSHSEESIIIKRLKSHFRKHFDITKSTRSKIIKNGVIFIILGILLMLLGTYVHFYYQNNFFTSFLIIFFEPGGWFFFWEGLYSIIYESKRRTPDYEFYEKMSISKIIFKSA